MAYADYININEHTLTVICTIFGVQFTQIAVHVHLVYYLYLFTCHTGYMIILM